MRSYPLFFLLGLVVCAVSLQSARAQSGSDTWVRFRGPEGTGVAPSGMTAPTEWSSDKNIKWQVDLPGMGASSPIVLGDKIYITSYTDYGTDKESPGDVADLKRHLICLDRNDGSEVWRSTIDSDHDEDPYKGFIQEHGYASSTPVTDGKMIYAFFGKTGVIGFDLEGKEIWKQNVGTMTDPAKWGGGSSCILVGDVLVVNAGNESRAVIGLNKSTGEEIWRVENEEFGNSWTTPSVVEVDGKVEVVLNMPGKIIGVDPKTGEENWHAKSPIERTTCASLAVSKGVVYAMGGRGGVAIAVKCGGKGDVSKTHTVWQKPLRAGIGTPIFIDGHLYWNSRGIAYCANAETGEIVFKERLKQSDTGESQGRRRSPAGDYASPISVGDHIYLTSRNGTVFVIDAKPEFKRVSVNQFAGDESLFNATPAVVDGELYFRSDNRLYCVSYN